MADKLYRVDDNYGSGKVVLCSVDIIKETPQLIQISRNGTSASLRAFNYKRRINKRWPGIHRTPREAIDAFIEDQQLAINEAQKEIGLARRNIAEAQKLYKGAGRGDSDDTPASSFPPDPNS